MKTRLYIFFVFLITNNFVNAQSVKDFYYLSLKQNEINLLDSSLYYLDKAINIDEGNYFLLFKKADLLLSQDKYSEAIYLLDKVNGIKSHYADYKLSTVYCLLGNNSKCLSYLKSHLQCKYKKAKSDILLDKTFYNIQESKEWKALWKNEWYSSKDEIIAEINYLISKGNLSEALNLSNSYLLKHKHDFSVLLLRSNIYALNFNFNSAVKDLNSVLNIKKEPEIYALKGRYLYKLRKYKKAIQNYNLAIQSDFTDLNLYLELAKAKNMNTDYKEAINDLLYYQRYSQNKDSANYYLGMVYYNMKKYYDAIPYFNSLIAKHPKDGRNYTTRAKIYAETHNYVKSNMDFSMLLDLEPKNTDVYFKMGLNYLKLNEYKNACYYFSKAKDYGSYKAKFKIKKYCR